MAQNKLKNTTGLQVGEVIYMTSTYTVEDDWETFPTYFSCSKKLELMTFTFFIIATDDYFRAFKQKNWAESAKFVRKSDWLV